MKGYENVDGTSILVYMYRVIPIVSTELQPLRALPVRVPREISE